MGDDDVEFDEESEPENVPTAAPSPKDDPNSIFWNPNDPDAQDPFADENEDKLLNSDPDVSDPEESAFWKTFRAKHRPKQPKPPKVKKPPREKKPKKLRIKKPSKPKEKKP